MSTRKEIADPPSTPLEDKEIEKTLLRLSRPSITSPDKTVPVLGRVGGSELSRAHWIAPRLTKKAHGSGGSE